MRDMLRGYQSIIAKEVEIALSSHKRIVVSCPTGSGKTVIALSGLFPILKKPVLWITHRLELAKQVREYGVSVEIVMIQSKLPPGDFSSVIIDESHHVCADQYRRLFDKYPTAIFVGLTATPYRMDGVGLGSCGFSKIVYGPDILELTERGFLCPARVLVPASESQGAWFPEATATQVKKQCFRKAIIYSRTVSDAVETSEHLNRLGIPAAAIHGELKLRKRRSLERRFRLGKLRVVCNHTIFTEGYDVPSTDLIVLNRLTQSRCLWRQMTGRGLRTHPNKESCTILDLAGNAISHGSLYDKEIYDLHGHVERTESREAPQCSPVDSLEYNYKHQQELKEWKPQPKPVSIIESLQRLKSRSPLLRLSTA